MIHQLYFSANDFAWACWCLRLQKLSLSAWIARDFGTWIPQYSHCTMGSFLIFFGFAGLEGGFWACSFSHELTNMTSSATVIIRIAVLNTMDVLKKFGILHYALKVVYTFSCHPEGSEVRTTRDLDAQSIKISPSSRWQTVNWSMKDARNFTDCLRMFANNKWKIFCVISVCCHFDRREKSFEPVSQWRL